ncbi:MAG: hypothetical protein V7651_04785 [Hyphomonas oceanitis]|uniref:hypothetical protein n=1 Tax=Hyphomonas oceanitis TaxID=81033 RepID=UPI0030015EE2
MNTAFIDHLEIRKSGRVHSISLFYLAKHEIEAAQLSSVLGDAIENRLAPDEIVFLVRSFLQDDLVSLLKTDSKFVTALRHLPPYTTVSVIAFDDKGSELPPIVVAGTAKHSAVRIGPLKRQILSRLFIRNNGFVEATDAYHFRNPSGRHTRKFMRASNVLVSQAEVSFLAFCILDRIFEECRYVYVDTPTLFSVVGAINDILHSFKRAPLYAHNFRSYEGALNEPFRENIHSLTLISASSSGSLAELLTTRKKLDPNKIVHLFFLGPRHEEYQIVANLERDQRENPEGADRLPPSFRESEGCKLCDDGSSAVELRGDQFHIATPDTEPLIILQNHGPKGLRDTMARIAGNGATSVSIGPRPKGDNTEYYIDFQKLLETPAYVERLNYFAVKCAPANTKYILSADKQSLPLIDHIQSICPQLASASIVDVSDIESLRVGATDAIMVVANVIESGRSLMELSQALRSVAEKTPLTYFVGLEKDSQSKARGKLSTNLTLTANPASHAYVAVERLVLPKSRSMNSWSQERDFWSNPRVKLHLIGAAREIIQARLSVLGNARAGAKGTLFLNADVTHPISLMPGWVFWPEKSDPDICSDSDAFYIVSGVLQSLRERERGSLPPGKLLNDWLNHTLVDPENFNRFNDTMIQAGLLRAATPAELNFANSEKISQEMRRIVCHLVDAHASPRGAAAAEFLLAVLLGRLTLQTADLKKVVEHCGSASDLLQSMGVLIDLVLVSKKLSVSSTI